MVNSLYRDSCELIRGSSSQDYLVTVEVVERGEEKEKEMDCIGIK